MSARSHKHDLRWRVGGLLLMGAGYASGAIGGASAALSLAGFALAIGGLVLAVQGGRVPAVLRIERGRHRDLPMAIHARRLARRRPHSRG